MAKSIRLLRAPTELVLRDLLTEAEFAEQLQRDRYNAEAEWKERDEQVADARVLRETMRHIRHGRKLLEAVLG